VHLVGFIKKKFVMMHSHMNVKFIPLSQPCFQNINATVPLQSITLK